MGQGAGGSSSIGTQGLEPRSQVASQAWAWRGTDPTLMGE